jgi:hypothetical protein
LTSDVRAIDAALAHENGNWYLAWKHDKTSCFAVSKSLSCGWEFIGEGAGSLDSGNDIDVDGNAVNHENCQFLPIDGIWHLLSTDYSPHHPWLYRMKGDSRDVAAWAAWHQGRRLMIPSQRFNSIPCDHPAVTNKEIELGVYPCWDNDQAVHIVDGLDNAAFVADWRDYDGYFYMIYAGKNEEGHNRFRATATGGGWPRGLNRLGLARSADLKTWIPAGMGRAR